MRQHVHCQRLADFATAFEPVFRLISGDALNTVFGLINLAVEPAMQHRERQRFSNFLPAQRRSTSWLIINAGDEESNLPMPLSRSSAGIAGKRRVVAVNRILFPQQMPMYSPCFRIFRLIIQEATVRLKRPDTSDWGNRAGNNMAGQMARTTSPNKVVEVSLGAAAVTSPEVADRAVRAAAQAVGGQRGNGGNDDGGPDNRTGDIPTVTFRFQVQNIFNSVQLQNFSGTMTSRTSAKQTRLVTHVRSKLVYDSTSHAEE